MSCPKCGSWAVRADRSLGGRMVCGRCGEPLGAKVIPLRRARRNPRPISGQEPRRWWLGLMALLTVSGLLAALQIAEEQGRSPLREGQGLGPRQRLF